MLGLTRVKFCLHCCRLRDYIFTLEKLLCSVTKSSGGGGMGWGGGGELTVFELTAQSVFMTNFIRL